MTGFIVCVFPFRSRVSSKEAFEGLELGEGKPSRPVLRGPGGRKAARLLGDVVRLVTLAIVPGSRRTRKQAVLEEYATTRPASSDPLRTDELRNPGCHV